MNSFQFISAIFLVAAILFLIFKFLNRHKGKLCADCLEKRRSNANWNLQTENVEVDPDDESDLSDEEEEEEDMSLKQ